MKIIKICLLFLLLYSFNIPGQRLPDRGICAHRGASWDYPENTKIAILEAISIGVQMIEFDVRSTKDHKLVVIHNKLVNKTTNGKGNVNELTLQQILQLDAGSWKSNKFKGQKIPGLVEILEIIPDSIWMNIHIKDDINTAKAVAKLLTERNQTSNAILAVEKESAKIVKSINSEIKICSMDRGDSVDEYIKNVVESKPDFIQLTEREYPELERIIPILKFNKIIVNFYYADTLDKIKDLFDAGVDFVLTNKSSTLFKEANKAGLFDKN